MSHPSISRFLVSAALLLSFFPSIAAEHPVVKPTTTDSAKAANKVSKQGDKKVAAQPAAKLVDINGASKAVLMTLPGITDVEADLIIAGRPYGSKSHLTTRGLLPRDTYEDLKRLVVAKQPKPDSKKAASK
jgi:DNA uptake protein ComE-like DNA-binding protein